MSCSSAGPMETTMVPGILCCSMVLLTAWAAPTATAAMTLCPSMWPGAPSTSGLRGILPGVCEPSGRASISVTDRDHRFSRAPGRPDIRRHAGAAKLNLEAGAFKSLFQILCALVLLHPRLAEVIEHVADGGDLFGISVDGFKSGSLRIAKGFGRLCRKC